MSDEANQAVNQLLQTANTMLQIVARLVEFHNQNALMRNRMMMDEIRNRYFMGYMDPKKNLGKDAHKEVEMRGNEVKKTNKEPFVENPNYLEDHDREAIKNLNMAEEIYEKDKNKAFTKAEYNRAEDFSNEVAKVFKENYGQYEKAEKEMSAIDNEIADIFTENDGNLSKEQENKFNELYDKKVDLSNKYLDKLDNITKELNEVFKEHEGDFLKKDVINTLKTFENLKKDLRASKRLERDNLIDATLGEGRNNLSKEYKKMDLSRDLTKLDKNDLESLKNDINKWKESRSKLMDSKDIFLEKEFIHFHNNKYNELRDLSDTLNKTENFLDNKLSEIDNILSKEKNINSIEKNTKDINVER